VTKSATAKVIALNRKAKFNFFLESKYEAGIVLTGPEIRSIRMGKVNIDSAYAMLTKGEVYLVGSHISECSYSTHCKQDPSRKRKLLLHSEEIRKIIGKVKKPGYSLIPCSMYFSQKGLVKVEIAIARGKKLYDKREDIKKRDLEREQSRSFKGGSR
jgi:SsrA-binding protein